MNKEGGWDIYDLKKKKETGKHLKKAFGNYMN